ncbi:hypothetical protein TNCV_1412991 [Trichonephila clavipes]|nr:hypothetical protein TNCV_1412991 [Trichonephila clavipes]
MLVSDEETCCDIRTREGKESIEDDRSSGCPQTSHTAENIEKVFQAERKKRLQTIAQTAESVRISKAKCQQILAKDLYMHRVCQHIVPHMLIKDQKNNSNRNDGKQNLGCWASGYLALPLYVAGSSYEKNAKNENHCLLMFQHVSSTPSSFANSSTEKNREEKILFA